jgi:hypothetical protein
MVQFSSGIEPGRQEPPDTVASESRPETGKIPLFREKSRLSHDLLKARLSFVTNDDLIIRGAPDWAGVCAFSGVFLGLEWVPLEWRYLVPPTSAP